MKFRKRPVVINALRWTGVNIQQLSEWLTQFHVAPPNIECVARFDFTISPPVVRVETLEGTMTAAAGDWIIRGIVGELYPCEPDVFEATYELVE